MLESRGAELPPALALVAAAVNEGAAGVVVTHRQQGELTICYCNDSFCSQTQRREADLLGRPLSDAPAFGAELIEAAEACTDGTTSHRRIAYRRGTELVPADLAVSRHAMGVNEWFHVLVVTDIEDDTAASDASDRDSRLLRAARATGLGHWDWDLTSGRVWYEPRFKELLGYADAPFANSFSAFQSLVHTDDRPLLMQALRLQLESRQRLDIAVRVMTMAAGERWFRVTGESTRDPAGRPVNVSGTIEDIHDSQRLRANERRDQESLRRSFDGLPCAVAVLNAAGEIVEINRVWREFAGDRALVGLRYGFGEDYARLCGDALGRCASGPAAARAVRSVLSGSRAEARLEYQVGDDRYGQALEMTVRAFEVDGGRGAIVTHTDITDLQKAHDDIRRTKEFYELVLDSLPLNIAYVNRDREFIYANRGYEEWLRLPLAALRGRTLESIMAPEGYEQARPRVEAVLRGETVDYLTHVVKDGVRSDFAVTYLPHRKGHDTIGFFSVVRDVTMQRRLENELRHSQNLEAVGQLTGGIAHDFNNLLSVVIGNMQLLERPLKDERRLGNYVSTALRAALRGADLTRRLLAFSRQQVLEPQVLDPSRLVADTQILLKRTIGPTIELRSELAADAWAVCADPGYLESSVLNLAINARDAMPTGGTLTLATRNVHVQQPDPRWSPHLKSGDYVEISVTDTGVGMPPEVMERAFEPFYTTKAVGQGTGLGLSTVYGYAEQSGGLATIESEVGRGTTVRILLPRSSAAAVESASSREEQRQQGNGETLLVVDPDDDVRQTTASALQDFGYRVVLAANAVEALAILSGNAGIALLVTEIMLPGGILGDELVARAREVHPGLPVLRTSAVVRTGSAADGPGLLLKKPYSIGELGRRIRALLEEETQDAE